MSIARHHAEWLSLLEISGPFLSMPVLLRAFPQGLEAHDPDVAREVRLAYEEWLDNQQGLKPEPAIHTAWIRFVLKRALGMPGEGLAEGQAIPPPTKATIAEQGETLRPDIALSPNPSPAGRGESRPRLLIQVYPPSQDLDKPITEKRWKASPATRMMELLRATDVRLGLVTNGERWMLVDAPKGGTSGFTSWYAGLWLEEPITLRAFRTLLGARRFFGVPDDETLEALLAESATDQQEVTEQLGYQVRRAVEVLIEAIDRADQDRGRALLAEISETTLYEAALTVMMRLVFLFSAEERGLLLLGDPLYDGNYAVSTLRAQLREAADQHGEEVLERRFDAWPRLLATFRAVHGGVQHEAMKLMAYGGSLFDPERFPFLEGRPPSPIRDCTDGGRAGDGGPLPINNRVILHLLEALQMLRVKVPGGGPAEARRLSFRALDVEQIGHVYESLLDHTAVRAAEPVVGLIGTKNKEPEIVLAELERRAKSQLPGTARQLHAKSQKPNEADAEFVEYLKEATGRSEAAIRRGLNDDRQRTDDEQAALDRLRTACNNDEALLQRVRPFIHLIRDDDFGLPAVIPTGSVYVTAGTDRRSSGTHYTPRSLTEPIVQHTLEPLVYIGPAEGTLRSEWQLKPPAGLLQLKVCDMAMGSGAFLVQTCRWLAERLVESWENVELSLTPAPSPHGGEGSRRPRITPEGKPSTGDPNEQLIPDNADERMAFARRIVADRCLYGVDKNPLAVEMAKLSLWLITLDKQRPFTFLNHALKCGDSLVGADEDMFLRWAHGLKRTEMTLFDEELQKELQTSNLKRQMLESFEVKDVRDAERKQALLEEADAAMARVKLGCDLIIGTRLLDLKPKEKEARLNTLLLAYMAGEAMESAEAQEVLEAAKKVKAFHWPFEFPEVFAKERGGFSAFVGNPPFMGGRNLTAQYGDEYADGMRSLYPSSNGGADLCTYFFLRAFEHLRADGTFGLIATNTIAQGDTRVAGLDYVLQRDSTIYFGVSTLAWPGVAAVFVSVVHLLKGKHTGEKWLNNQRVPFISSLLDSTLSLGEPKRLFQNAAKSFQGSIVLGMGFILEPREAQALIAKDPKNSEVLFPYLNGEDLNSRPDQSPSRWVINFGERTEKEARQYKDCFQIVQEKVYPERATKDQKKYPRMVDEWWKHWNARQELHKAISSLSRTLIRARVTRTHAFAFCPTSYVYPDMIVVLAYDDDATFALVQSSLHEIWAWKYGSTLKTDLRYSPTDCFETFPFPQSPTSDLATLTKLGREYYEHRGQIMLTRHEGLTRIYKRFHASDETSVDITELRLLHVKMDYAVTNAYGWINLDLAHGYYETPQGPRYTLNPQARQEVLARLLLLNHKLSEEETIKKQRRSQKIVANSVADRNTDRRPTRKARKKKSGEDDTDQLGLL